MAVGKKRWKLETLCHRENLERRESAGVNCRHFTRFSSTRLPRAAQLESPWKEFESATSVASLPATTTEALKETEFVEN
jgi:hypothetical protein